MGLLKGLQEISLYIKKIYYVLHVPWIVNYFLLFLFAMIFKARFSFLHSIC